jgi:hypothetical protein
LEKQFIKLKYKITIKRVIKILLYILVVMISFITTSYLVLRDPWVQTLSARIASHYLSVQLHTDIRIGGFDISLRHGLTIRDIFIKDQHRLDIFSAHKLSIIPGKYSLSKKILNVKSVFIDNGLIQLVTHRGDSVLNLQFIIDYFTPKASFKPYDTARGPKWHIFVAKVELASTRFHFQDENKPLTKIGMDYNNIDVSDINLLIRAFHPDGDTLNGRIDRLSATERSGFSVHSMSGDFQVSSAFLKAHHLKLVTNHSDLDLTFDFLYNHWNAYNDFLNKVQIHASINPSFLDLQDIGAFAPVLYVMKDRFKIEGTIRGTVSNFTARDFRIAYGSGTRFFGNIHSYGLPNVEETFADVNIRDFKTSQKDIHSLNLPIEGKNLEVPDFLKNVGVYNLKGNFTGFYNDFVANAELNTDIGELKTDLTLRKQKGIKGVLYNGEADITGLQLGQLFKSKTLLGPITLRADLNGRSFILKDAIVKMNVWIDSVSLNNYTYRHITLQGGLENKKFTGKMNVDDRNLNLDFDGLVDLGDSLPAFNFDMKLNHAQLFKMNLLKRDSLEELSAHVNVDFTGNNLDNIEGAISIDSTRYQEGVHNISMNHLSLLTRRDTKNNKSYHLLSDFVDADVSGNFNFKDMIPSLSDFISNYLASFELKKSLINKHPSTNQQINYVAKLKKTDPVMEVFIPFIRVAPGTNFEGSYNENEGMISLNGDSPDLSLFGKHFTGWFIKATSRQENLNIQTGCSKFFVQKGAEKDSALIMMDSLHLVSNLHHDSIFYDLFWSMGKIKSDLGGFVNFQDTTLTFIRLTRFHAFIDHHYWSIASDNEITIDTSAVFFHDLAFESGEQKLQVDGKIGNHPEDTLRFKFNKVDISDADYLLGNPDVDIDGILSGSLKLMNIPHSLRVLSDLDIDKFAFNKELLGDAQFKIFYDDKEARFDVDSRICSGNEGTNIPLALKGSYYLGKPEPHMDFYLTLKKLNLKMISPFVASFMSRLNGSVSGDVRITGSLDVPRLAGKLELVKSEFKINYLNIPYFVDDVVTVDSTAFNFDHVSVSDSLGNRAYLSGKIYHNYFHDLKIDLSIDAEDFSIFRNTYAQNNIFYGTARGTGNVRITGTTDNISISAKAQTGGGTHVHIPISTAADIGQNDYIVFSKPLNDSTRKTELFPGATPTGLSLALAILINPSADVEVTFPEQMGNIKATGSGNLTMEMTPSSAFTLTGSYIIQKGTFHFQMKNLMRLVFSIEDQSKISWSGDPANANINMSAIYSTRVPLGDLASKEEDKTTRIPVECIIRLSGQLANPDISFGLNLPNATDNINTIVYGVIDTTNKVEMNQQMFNILVFNQFQSNKGTLPSNIDVGSTSLSIFMNQVNSLLSRVSKDVNIGVDYRRSLNTPGQEIDLALSTQLFNERLLLDGLFGVNSMNPNPTVQKASTIVGDIKIQYILSNNRRWRIRAFNRTNTVDLLDNNAPYTQGVGLSYLRDFNHWGDFFKSDKVKNKKPVHEISK